MRRYPCGQAGGKARFDQPPAGCEVAIAIGQGPDRVQMVGQNHPSLDLKRAFGSRHPHGLAQAFDFKDQQITAALLQGEGEIECGGGDAGADVMCHADSLAWQGLTLS